jgi:hypothetical protein
MTITAIIYALFAIGLAVPIWRVTGTLGQKPWIRVVLTLAGPLVALTAIGRRLTLGRW